MTKFKPDDEVLKLVRPFSAELHSLFDAERKISSRLHDLNTIEFVYQITLELGAAALLVPTDDPMDLQEDLHTSTSGGDDHLSSWCLLVTGLECDPPVIGLLSFTRMICNAFVYELNPPREDYIYAFSAGVDWMRGNNEFGHKMLSLQNRAQLAVPQVPIGAGRDCSFWRIGHAYLREMKNCENSRLFRTPRRAALQLALDPRLLMAFRAVDTETFAWMSNDGAAWMDDAGFDSMISSGLSNDVVDFSTDIKTGETRNLLRLLYPDGLNISQAVVTVSTIFSGLLCEQFRIHYRARFANREDGRISIAVEAYNFARCRHRRIFETMELYVNRYPQFWDWTWEIWRRGKDQITEGGLSEPLVCALQRAAKEEGLSQSPATTFYNDHYELVETGDLLTHSLGVSGEASNIIRDLHHLWHGELLASNKEPGWGRDFDVRSDMLLGQAGNILLKAQDTEKTYDFVNAYRKLCIGLPYVAHHTIAAIIMAYGL